MGNFPSIVIDKFLGMNTSRNKLGLLPGQLSRNENYLYMSTGGLEERGGGAKLSDPPAASVVFGGGNLELDDGTQYLITVQGTTIYYYDSAWIAVKDASNPLIDFVLSASDKKIRFENAGYTTASTFRSLYGVNANEEVIKIYKDGSNIVAKSIASSPTDLIKLKLHKNRLFGIDGKDTLYFTDSLAFDTWNTVTNNIPIFPGNYGRLKGLEIFGDALFIFKEYAVFVLPNAADADPTNSWNILKVDAYTGTQSPDSVRLTADGIYYFSTDNYIRKINPTITFSSGEYTLGGSGSPIISHPIQDDIRINADLTAKDDYASVTFKDLYILSFKTVNNASAYNDKTFFLDTTKFLPAVQGEIPQPFAGEFTGFNYNFYVIQNVTGEEKLYGFKGNTSDPGICQETLNSGIHNDNDAAIVSYAILGWVAPGGEYLYKKFKSIVFMGDTESWYIYLKFNSYRLGKILPSDGEGTSKSFTTSLTASAIVDTAIVDTAVISAIGISSSRYKVSLKGQYLTAEFSNPNVNEFTRINKLIVFYRPINQK